MPLSRPVSPSVVQFFLCVSRRHACPYAGRRLSHPPDAGDGGPGLHERPQLLRPLLLRRLHARRQLHMLFAFGLYPNVGVMDAFATIVVDGKKQYIVRASRALGNDRMDTKVGPIGVRDHRAAADVAHLRRSQRDRADFDLRSTGGRPRSRSRTSCGSPGRAVSWTTRA